MKKPAVVKALQIVDWIGLGAGIVIYLSFYLFLVIKGTPGSGYWEFKAGFLSTAGITPETYSSGVFFYLMGYYSIPLILTLLNLLFLRARMYKSLIVILVLQMIYGLGRMSVTFLIGLVFLLLVLLNRNAKQYLKRVEEKQLTSELPVE